MVRKIILLVVFLLLVSCSNSSNISEFQNSGVVYQENASNKVPAVTSTNQKAPNCVNECTVDGCVNNDFFECKTNEDGCNYFVKIGPVLGKCDVECFEDADCERWQKCFENETKYRLIFQCVNRTIY